MPERTFFCTKCGTPFVSGATFCTNCGSTLEIPPQPAREAAHDNRHPINDTPDASVSQKAESFSPTEGPEVSNAVPPHEDDGGSARGSAEHRVPVAAAAPAQPGSYAPQVSPQGYQPQPQQYAQPYNQPIPQAEPEKKKKSGLKIAVIISAIVVLLAGLAALVIFVLVPLFSGGEGGKVRDPAVLSEDGTVFIAYKGGETSVIIPEGVTEIEADAFMDNTDIEEIIFPSTLQRIGAGAFSGCSSLENFILPEALQRIGARAFADCTSLTEITLHPGLTRIGSKAFDGGRNLTLVVFRGTAGHIYAEENGIPFEFDPSDTVPVVITLEQYHDSGYIFIDYPADFFVYEHDNYTFEIASEEYGDKYYSIYMLSSYDSLYTAENGAAEWLSDYEINLGTSLTAAPAAYLGNSPYPITVSEIKCDFAGMGYPSDYALIRRYIVDFTSAFDTPYYMIFMGVYLTDADYAILPEYYGTLYEDMIDTIYVYDYHITDYGYSELYYYSFGDLTFTAPMHITIINYPYGADVEDTYNWYAEGYTQDYIYSFYLDLVSIDEATGDPYLHLLDWATEVSWDPYYGAADVETGGSYSFETDYYYTCYIQQMLLKDEYGDYTMAIQAYLMDFGGYYGIFFTEIDYIYADVYEYDLFEDMFMEMYLNY